MGEHLKNLLAEGRLIRVFALGQLCHPKLVEMVGWLGGYDAVWLDQEHAGLSTRQIEEAARAARACGLDSFVRLAATDYAAVMRPLEAGAGAVMAARVHSAAQVEEFVGWAKFHPRGRRGVNGTGVDGRYGATPSWALAGRKRSESTTSAAGARSTRRKKASASGGWRSGEVPRWTRQSGPLRTGVRAGPIWRVHPYGIISVRPDLI